MMTGRTLAGILKIGSPRYFPNIASNEILDKVMSCKLSGYHADTPITIKAEAIHEADSRIH